MARSEIILGTPPQGLGGDPPRVASMKINAMTDELYRGVGGKAELAAVTNTDVGALRNTGGWFMSPAGNTNNPPELPAVQFGIFHAPSQNAHAFQFASPVTSTATARTRLWFRQFTGTTWSPWVELLSGAGTAAKLDANTSNTDTTPGRLMRNGDGGINSAAAPTIADMNAPAASGFSWVTSGTLNQFPGFASGSQVQTVFASATEIAQIAFSRSTPMNVAFRRMTSGNWQPTQMAVFYPAGQTFLSVAQGGNGNANGISDQAQTALNAKADKTAISNVNNTSDLNKPISTAAQTALNTKFDAASAILDPQSAGGLMSYTSNATGEIWKFLNGMMITSQTFTGPAGTWSEGEAVRYKDYSGTFPAAFFRAPKIHATLVEAQIASRGAWISNVNGVASAWQAYLCSVKLSTNTAAVSLNILAIGTWK